MAWDIPGMAILPVWVISGVDALDSRFCNSGNSENQNIGRLEGKKVLLDNGMEHLMHAHSARLGRSSSSHNLSG